MNRKYLTLVIFLLIFILNACANHSEKTSLMQAVSQSNLLKVQQLIQQGTNVNARDQTGLDALSYSIINDRPNIVQYLLENGADVNSANNGGTTELMIAATVGDINIIKMLHDRGAKINAANNEGITALMAAAGSGNEDTLLLLLSYGADPCSTDKNLRNARQTAELWLGVNETQQSINQNKMLAGINCTTDKHE